MIYMLLRYPGGKRKAVTFSYDDAQVFDRELVGIFNKYVFVIGLVFIITPISL